MSGRLSRCVVALLVVLALGAVQLPVAVVPAGSPLVTVPAKHRPKRGPSRDRSLPGKARRQARRRAA